MNDTPIAHSAHRPCGCKDVEMFGEAIERTVRVVAAPGLATLAREVVRGVHEERRAADEAANRARLARQTAGYD